MSRSGEKRLKRLRDLLDKLERLPASAERERMLREVRARVVDVDTGESPRAMLPVDLESTRPVYAGPPATPVPKPVLRTPADQRGRPRMVRVPEPAKPVRVAPVVAVTLTGGPVGAGDVLSLDDSPSPEPHAGPAAGPWTRGLRG
jgi:hypothetical protein